MATKKEKAKMDFGEAFAELERITDWFDRGEIDLEEGLEKFERGLELAATLKRRLRAVENRVEEIKVKFSDLVEGGAAPEADGPENV